MKSEKNRFWLAVSAVLWLLLCAASMFAQGNGNERSRKPFPGIQIGRQVRGEEAIAALGSRLPEVAAWYGQSTSELAQLLRHDRTLWVSPSGRLVYACELEEPLEAVTAAAGTTRDHVTLYPLDQTFKLHSLPGSKRVIYLDFNGQTVSGTAWNSSYNGGADIVAAPFSLDSDSSTFSTSELQMIQYIWQRVAEDYSPFDVDVTTEEPTVDALKRTSTSDLQFGNRVIITPTNFYPNAGGVSYIGAFDDVGDTYKISWVFSNMLSNGEKYIAEACSHENGHSVGLHHEGTTSGTTYYQGQGVWAPIMGNSYYKNVTQWAKGEYTGANNTEDQLQVMQNYGLAYFEDDHGNTKDAATALPVSSTISTTGFIERNTDVDVFKFLAGTGTVALTVSAAPRGPDLKVLAELRDGSWNLIATSSLSTLGASFNTSVPSGTYYLTVTGTGMDDPATTGFSKYASLGQYIVAGTVADPGSLNPPTAVIVATPTSGDAPLTVTLSGSGSTDDGSIVSYAWDFGDGSNATGDAAPVHTYTEAGTFTAKLTVTDNSGLTSSSTVAITAKKYVRVTAIALAGNSSSTAVSATASVTVKDLLGNPISGATVTGAWSGLVQGSSSAVTNSSGIATLSSPQSSASGTVTFTVSGVSASNYVYAPQQNLQSSASIALRILQTVADTTAPSIAIKSPVTGATVSGTVSVLVSASDNVAVTKVELYVDGIYNASSLIAPFTVKWNSKKASTGQHTLTCKAYDGAGNSKVSDAVTVKK